MWDILEVYGQIRQTDFRGTDTAWKEIQDETQLQKDWKPSAGMMFTLLFWMGFKIHPNWVNHGFLGVHDFATTQFHWPNLKFVNFFSVVLLCGVLTAMDLNR